jgi:hypothetical protein
MAGRSPITGTAGSDVKDNERGCGRNNNTLAQFMLHCNTKGVTLDPRSRFASDGAIDAAQ